MITKEIEYHVGGKRFVGFFAAPDGAGKRPGALVAPEGGGRWTSPTMARRHAEAGLRRVRLDYYGDGKPLEDITQAMARIGAWIADPTGIRAPAVKALKVLTAQPQTDAAGSPPPATASAAPRRWSWPGPAADLKAVVGFHSGLGTARPAEGTR